MTLNISLFLADGANSFGEYVFFFFSEFLGMMIIMKIELNTA